MKKALLFVILISLILGNTTVIMAKIEGTSHDLSTIKGDSHIDSCTMCHTRHSDTGQLSLWNSIQTVETFQMYASPTFAINSGDAVPNEKSLSCLSCHNGIIGNLVKHETIGNDLTDDHPVSFNYNPSKDVNGNGFPSSITKGVDGKRFIYGTITGTFYPLSGNDGNRFECTTCHIMHATSDNHSKGHDQVKLLRANNMASNMCKDCHTNK